MSVHPDACSLDKADGKLTTGGRASVADKMHGLKPGAVACLKGLPEEVLVQKHSFPAGGMSYLYPTSTSTLSGGEGPYLTGWR